MANTIGLDTVPSMTSWLSFMSSWPFVGICTKVPGAITSDPSTTLRFPEGRIGCVDVSLAVG